MGSGRMVPGWLLMLVFACGFLDGLYFMWLWLVARKWRRRATSTIPAKEAWLFQNGAALASVMRGLEQTGRGGFAEPPDLEADAKLGSDVDEVREAEKTG